jgi:mono/diheme cytochrome c family protein
MNAGSRKAAVIAALAPFLTPACGFQPRTPELEYSLNLPVIAKNAELADDPGAQAQLAGALQLLAGTPQAPSLLALPAWIEEGFDPNYWGADLVRADEAAWKSLVESNRGAYRAQIAAIQEGRFDDVPRPRYADDLWADWLELRSRIEDPAAAGERDALRQEAVQLFEEYYPSLANSAGFYRLQCFHCHGAEGGGNGSTSPFLEPRPRDYRPGKFKFTALKGKARPRHEDLFRVLAEGIYTTAMPSFRRFTDAQLHGLVDYVRLLAIRGETEILIAGDYTRDDGIHFDNVRENYELVVERWREAPGQLITYDQPVPEATAERVEHGRYLFTTPGEKGGANCVSCHGVSARGDGVSAKEIDPATGELSWVKDEWGHEIQPRDLTRGVFRFGRRPIDLYRRIYAGINGTAMPEHIGMSIKDPDGTQRALDEDDLWDLVFFVRAISSQEPRHD